MDPAFTGSILDTAVRDPDLARLLPYLQAHVALDTEGLGRLEAAAREGLVDAHAFNHLATGVIEGAPAEPMVAMLDALSHLVGGVGVALDILSMRLHAAKRESCPNSLLGCARDLLRRVDLNDIHGLRAYGLHTVVELCLVGPETVEDAKVICANFSAALENFSASAHDADHLLEGIFQAQPEAALDGFLLGRHQSLFRFPFVSTSPVENLGAETLCTWADKDAHERYPLLGRALHLFVS